MIERSVKVSVAGFLMVGLLGAAAPAATSESETEPIPERIQFNRDVRPILSKACLECHGPGSKNRQTDLRFSTKEEAYQDLGGYKAIVPGKPGESELIDRVTAEDPDKRMPPADAGHELSERQIEILRRWIEQGAGWERYWAFQKPERPAVPEVENDGWVRNPIDRFVLDRLEEEGLSPSGPADKRTLIRRVALDLTGLPPTPEQVQRFVQDDSADAYEQMVDRFLNSPRYGERMAKYWLDAARYGDTHGMHLDNKRSIWPYRDWVINAFNENKPFDEFTVEQLAGDLLKDPTREQLVATGFNRANITSSEGGSIDKELWVRYTKDRAIATGTVFMGLTFDCAQCHDHKYDPVSQQEFYELYAFFFDMADKPRDGNAFTPPPTLKLPSEEQQKQIKRYGEQIAALRKEIDAEVKRVEYDPDAAGEAEKKQPDGRRPYVWVDDSLPDGVDISVPGGESGWPFVAESKEHPVYSGSRSHTRSADGRAQHYFTGAKQKLKIGKGDTLFAYVHIDPYDPPKSIMLQFNDGDWSQRAFWGEDVIPFGESGTTSKRHMGPLPKKGEWVRLEVPVAKVGLKPGDTLNGVAFTQHDGTVHWDKMGIVTAMPQGDGTYDTLAAWEKAQKAGGDLDSLPKPIRKIVKTEAGKRNEKQQARLRDYFVEHVWSKTRSTFKPLHGRVEELKNKRKAVQDAIPQTLITRVDEDGKFDGARFLKRGAYDAPDHKVSPGVPEILPDLDPRDGDGKADRLDLARWLVDEEHPLTARVTANRFWQHHFGRGIVKTSENFGVLGEQPTHPDLLTWLAVEFMDSGWDVKRMHKLIVTSATYRQRSAVSPDLQKRDPNNRLLARGPHYRLDAETIRDQALFVSGLLNGKIGGRPVKPYQPEGLWKAVAYEGSNTDEFKRDSGGKLYRRSLYTFWKRTSPPPNMSLFDAPTRESCTVRRERTNTPLQALVLMNDVQFVEAARHMAERIMHADASTVRSRIDYAFRLVLARHPSKSEMELMLDQYQHHLAKYEKDPSAARQLVNTGASGEPDEALPRDELAAWTMISNLLLNLSETITKG